MKRFVSLVLSALCVFGVAVFAPTDIEASAASGYEPGDIAAVYIETDNTVNPDYYVGCTIRIVDKEGGEYAELYDSAASIKIRGNSTSSGAKKPYNFKFSSKTNVFGMGKAKKWCLLANCYEKTLIRNEMVFDFARQTVLRYTPDLITQSQIWQFLLKETERRNIGMILVSHSEALTNLVATRVLDLTAKEAAKE